MGNKSTSKAKQLMTVLEQYSGTLLLIILAFAFFTRIYRLYLPEGYMFDEVYHAVTIKLIAANDPRAYEWWNEAPEPDTAVDWLHPPTAKLIQAVGVLWFGANSFGWRVSSAIAGVLVVLVVYQLARSLLDDVLVALVAAMLVSLDGLLLVQSRIAMNDIFVTLFILLAFWQYWQYRHHHRLQSIWWAGMSAGLAVSSKWSGVYAFGVIWLFELLAASAAITTGAMKNQRSAQPWQKWLKPVGISLSAFVCIPIIVYLLSYSQMWLQGKDLTHFKELHKQIWYYQTHLDATHPYQSQPLEWVLNTRPVWYHVDYLDKDGKFLLMPVNKWRADIYASGNIPMYWMGLAAAIASLVWFSYQFTHLKPTAKNSKKIVSRLSVWLNYATNSPQLYLLVAYAIVWMPWFFSPRIMFFYHYAPAIPLMCILLSYWLVKLAQNDNKYVRYFVFAAAMSIGLYFLVWFPHWTGIMMPTAIKDHIYFASPSWK